jgi:hypothetical protein
MIIISPYSQKMPVDKVPSGKNPKNYPHWEEFISLLKQQRPDVSIVQIGVPSEPVLKGVDRVEHNLAPEPLLKLAQSCTAWLSVDNFFQHFCAYYKIPNGFVVFGQSDPKIFGHEFNTNVLKNPKYLRPRQFQFWWQTEYKEEVFVSAEDLVKIVLPALK